MKKLFALLITVQLVGCASVSDLKESKTCEVWEDQPVVGPFHVSVEQKQAYWEGSCSFLGIFLCKWVKTDMEGAKLMMDANGVFNSRSHVASFTGKTLSYEKTFMDSIAKIEPIKINRSEKLANVQTSVFGTTSSSNRKIEFNNACTDKQVAMGIVTLITAKNRIK